jgi:hypothetical protein
LSAVFTERPTGVPCWVHWLLGWSISAWTWNIYQVFTLDKLSLY